MARAQREAPRRRRSRPRARRRRSSAAAGTPHSVPVAFAPRLREPPHAHIVCRRCGRILRRALPDSDLALLSALADAALPDGWSVEGIAFSMTGHCPACRRNAGA